MGANASKHGKKVGSSTKQKPSTKKPTETQNVKTALKKLDNKPKVDKSKAYILSSGAKEEKSEDPREAARRAAEERLKKQNSSNGALGAKLAKEKAQSSKKHVQALSEQEVRNREIDRSMAVHE